MFQKKVKKKLVTIALEPYENAATEDSAPTPYCPHGALSTLWGRLPTAQRVHKS